MVHSWYTFGTDANVAGGIKRNRGHISLKHSSLVVMYQALDTMKQTGMVPDTYCMNSLMAVGVAARQPNTALEIFREMANDGIARDVVSARWHCTVDFAIHMAMMPPQASATPYRNFQ